MSIVLAAAKQEQLSSPVVLAVLAVAAIAAFGLMRLAGAFRPRSEATLKQLFPAEPAWPLLWNVLVAAVVYIGASILFVAVMAVLKHQAATEDIRSSLKGGTLVGMAILMSMTAFVSLLLGLWLFIPGGFDRVGLNRSLPKATIFAVGIIAGIMPLMFLVMDLAERIYRWAGFQHEDAHELLDAMRSNGPVVRMGGIVAAVIVAPLAEELFFRGHLQPMLRKLFTRRTIAPMVAPVPSPELAQPAYAVPYGDQPTYLPPPLATQVTTLPLDYASPPASLTTFMPSLLAVILTSLCFAAVHPSWSWPPIFFLSLALGYAYEKTGNLWVPIIMHACFNGAMTSLFLSQL